MPAMFIRAFVVACYIGRGWPAMAQIPVEVFGGHERTTVDILFFKFFKKSQGDPSRWLFFNRNRASIDYRMTEDAFLPQFGFTEAISYNHEQLRGFAPVLVGQVLNRGLFSKTGVQYAHSGKQFTVFTWVVYEFYQQPTLDYFLLCRYTPRLSDRARLFLQLESVNAFSLEGNRPDSFVQRLRAGVQFNTYQLGAGVDLNQTTNRAITPTSNVGIFVRHEF